MLLSKQIITFSSSILHMHAVSKQILLGSLDLQVFSVFKTTSQIQPQPFYFQSVSMLSVFTLLFGLSS